MRFRRSSAFAAVVLSAALLFAPSVRAVDTPATSQWLVTSAKATGATGELFVTSLRIVNPGGAQAIVDLFYYPRVNFDQGTNSAPGDNTAAAKTTVVVPPGQTLQLDDVLATQFGRTGPSDSGGIRLESNNPVSVLSQTLVTNARSSTGVPGTNGFAIPAQLIENAVAAGDTAYVPYLSAAPDLTAGYRSNLFLLSGNANADTVVNVKLVNGSDGTTIGARDVTLGKLVQTQINNIAKVYGFTQNFTNLTAVLTVKSGGPVFAGASIIDNAISSQIYAPPTKVWLPNNSAFGLILNDGYGFAGRLDIENGLPDFLSATLVVENCPAAPGPTTQTFLLQAASYSPFNNTTFTKNTDGTFSMAGQSTSASWTGTITPNADGALFGNFTYTRAGGASCSGGSVTLTFVGSRAFGLSGTP
jgi:hypothetical protein